MSRPLRGNREWMLPPRELCEQAPLARELCERPPPARELCEWALLPRELCLERVCRRLGGNICGLYRFKEGLKQAPLPRRKHQQAPPLQEGLK